MAVSADHHASKHPEENEPTELDGREPCPDVEVRAEVLDNPAVRRVLDRIREGAPQGPTAHTKHASHSSHSTHSAGWLEPKR